ncbi:MAG: DUF4013 domain-containing protein [Pirellulaceae bacterium]
MASNETTGPEDSAFPPLEKDPAAPGRLPGDEPSMEYLRAFSYVFENPNWLMTLLIGGLCYFSQSVIPVVGGLLFLGYQFEVAEALLRNKGTSYPEFNFDRFSDYLMRGIWPLLVSLVVAMIAIVPVAMVMGVMMGLFGAVAQAIDDDVAPVLFFLMMGVSFLLMMVLAAVMALFITPMTLRAGLTQQFGEAFNFRWARDFVGRTWLEMILFWCFFMMAAMVLAPLGLAVFCVGIYAVSALMVMAQAHVYYQLYSLYLARGGEPIPLDPPIK